MSKRVSSRHQKYIRKAKLILEETKLDKAVKLYGLENGRIINAVHDVARSGIGTFSERLEKAFEIIEMNKTR